MFDLVTLLKYNQKDNSD